MPNKKKDPTPVNRNKVLAKAANRPVYENMKPTTDSTEYYLKKMNAAKNNAAMELKTGIGYSNKRAFNAIAVDAGKQALRQFNKGLPGYDKNGFPAPNRTGFNGEVGNDIKAKIATKKKMPKK